MKAKECEPGDASGATPLSDCFEGNRCKRGRLLSRCSMWAVCCVSEMSCVSWHILTSFCADFPGCYRCHL